MNPHKVVDAAYLPTENQRLGADYKPLDPHTHFQFPDDHGSFAEASLRCVGLGECRKHDGGTMCPSYMATLEEEHSTRGRARLLFEMLQNEVIGGWREERVKKALDLCLSCKACKSECPTNVDMATYKAEFLSHYYEGRRRPLHAYAFGMIDRWARLGSLAPGIANLASHAPGMSHLMRSLLQLAPERRQIPRLSNFTFRSWARKHRHSGYWRCAKQLRPRLETKVILWADTFNNFFHPETCQAALEVLKQAGFRVAVPRAHFCCGRPLYDFGMLDRAKGYLQRILLELLGPQIDAGVPIVVLEPSCASVFLATNCATFFPPTRAPNACAANRSFSVNFWSCARPL